MAGPSPRLAVIVAASRHSIPAITMPAEAAMAGVADRTAAARARWCRFGTASARRAEQPAGGAGREVNAEEKRVQHEANTFHSGL